MVSISIVIGQSPTSGGCNLSLNMTQILLRLIQMYFGLHYRWEPSPAKVGLHIADLIVMLVILHLLFHLSVFDVLGFARCRILSPLLC